MLEGTLTALVTPFRGGAVDEEALRGLIERQIEAEIDGLVPCGSTGESATLSYEEHHRVVEITIEAAAGRVPVFAGTGSNSTREAIDFTNHAKRAGADGALLLSPYYNKPTQEGIYLHYQAIAQETGLPLVIYNIPGRTASNIEPETIGRLARIDNVIGVKESSGDLDQIAHVVACCPTDFSVVSGDDALTLPLMSVGGKGVISTSSNVAPSLMVSLVRHFAEGQPAKSRAVHQQLLPLFDALFSETNPIPVKAALTVLGLCDGEIRLPLTPMTAPNLEQLKVVMKDLGILQ